MKSSQMRLEVARLEHIKKALEDDLRNTSYNDKDTREAIQASLEDIDEQVSEYHRELQKRRVVSKERRNVH